MNNYSRIRDIIREFNIKCSLVIPEDKLCKPYVTLQVPKGITLAHQLDSLPNEIHTLINSYINNDVLMMQGLKDSLKKPKCKPNEDIPQREEKNY